MATYQSGRVNAAGGTTLDHVPARVGVGLVEDYAEYTVSTALALNDVIQMLNVGAGARVLELVLISQDLDTNGSPTIVLDVGDGADTDRYIDGTTIGQTGGTTRLGQGITATGNILFEYTADDTIDILVQAGPATGATSVKIALYALISYANLV